MLEVRGLNASYGRARVLFDLDLEVRTGEIVALLGRNGAGKSTLLKSLIGWLRPVQGRIAWNGLQIEDLPAWRIARLGLGYVPEDRRIFTDLTVMQNLEVGRQAPRAGAPAWTPEKIFALFPDLEAMRDRPAARMSGGEQQMLTVARTLMGNPRLLLLDEPSEGLAPLRIESLAHMILGLKREGLTVLLCEQNLGFARRVADRVCIIESGRMRYAGVMSELDADPALRERYLAL